MSFWAHICAEALLCAERLKVTRLKGRMSFTGSVNDFDIWHESDTAIGHLIPRYATPARLSRT